MSNENGWTFDSLIDHLRQSSDAEAKRVDQKFHSEHTRLEERFLSQKEALIVTAELAKEAKQSANEWRGAMKDREAMFLPREEFQGILKEWQLWREQTVHQRETLSQRIAVIETRSVTWTAAIGVFFVVVQIVMFWMLRK